MTDTYTDSNQKFWNDFKGKNLDHWAFFDIHIVAFRSWGDIFPISAEVKKMDPADSSTTNSAVVDCTGNNISVSLSAGATSKTVALAFQLARPDYVLLGASWVPANEAAYAGLSTSTFKDVLIRREIYPLTPIGGAPAVGSCMLMTVDLPSGESPLSYNYLIFVQKVETGEIGVIDPRIIANPN